MLKMPVAEYQMPILLACSWGLYHSAVIATKHGETALSSKPRKTRCTYRPLYPVHTTVRIATSPHSVITVPAA